MEIFSFSFYLYLIVIVALITIVKVVFLSATFEKPKPRKLLIRSEYKFYFTLKEAFPEYVILVQVGFAAMLQAKHRATVNRFLAKRADYVICDQELNILLIVELDGTSHFGREKEDKKRDKLLTDAGYKIVHLKNIPSPQETRKMLLSYMNN